MDIQKTLNQIGRLLVDQEAARVIIPAEDQKPGFWFGGGNMLQETNGNLYLCGRYRNSGDSRTGTNLGVRGKELAIFKSLDKGTSFEKIATFDKSALAVGDWEVLSIEGSALFKSDDGIDLYVSTEKKGRRFPAGLEQYQKPGTGSWTIERMHASAVEELNPGNISTALASDDPRWFNTKDPFIYRIDTSRTVIGYCTHPFNWASSNTAYNLREDSGISVYPPPQQFFPRGECWDVGVCRATAFLDLPRIGSLSGRQYSLCFYDGAESMRDFPQHTEAKNRPRGYSCEELGGLGFFVDRTPETINRLSVAEPAFVSPFGTGSSRYVDVLDAGDSYFVTWQQSRTDGSQPLVLNIVPKESVIRILESS